MAKLKRLVLDVLKPHQPNIIDFAKALSALGSDYRINLHVEEVDDKTESVTLRIEGADLDFVALQALINEAGASLHSIDEVEVVGDSENASTET